LSTADLKPVMIKKGQEVLCIKTINAGGKDYFIEGKTYTSPYTNCLTNESGENNFVTVSYLKHFFL